MTMRVPKTLALFVLWTAQLALAGFYWLAGTMKLSQPVGYLATMGVKYATNYPEALTLFIGTVELLGAIALILPVFFKASALLVPIAAAGFSMIQALAILLHVEKAGHAEAVTGNIVLFCLAAFVMWGRLPDAASHIRRNMP